jgi:phosphate transport system permease protein
MRFWRDRILRRFIGVGGISVIGAILLIFVFLLDQVWPLFEQATAESVADYVLPGQGTTVHLAMEEQAEIGVRFTDAAHAVFFHLHNGETIEDVALDMPGGAQAGAFHAAGPAQTYVAYATGRGEIVVARHAYRITFPADKRLITPYIDYPIGSQPIQVDPRNQSLEQFAFQLGEERNTVVALTEDSRLVLARQELEGSFLDEDEASWVTRHYEMPSAGFDIDFLLLDRDQRIVYALSRAGELVQYDVSDAEDITLQQRKRVVAQQRQVSEAGFLTGSISLLITDSSGQITQWFPVRDDNNQYTLTRIRSFHAEQPVKGLAVEQQRKGFATVGEQGSLAIYHTTAGERVYTAKVGNADLERLAFSPRADAVVMEDTAGQLHFWHVENEFPEVSLQSLWGKVWYESYPEPDYIWQSSSASNDFEAKFSLVPISFGTLKAAFYAMLIAVPLSILGAMFTAYFMAPKMRQLVKPSIEIMEALPTVILGFLAGLWLAPFLEGNMPGVFSLLILMPPAVVFAAWSWTRLPEKVRHTIPDGWEAMLLIPLVIVVGVAAIALSPMMEQWWFGGDMRLWLTNELGIGFDQRNAIVVGLAMGFAVIPTIFSIAEDAVFSVPKSLTQGSLALGATPWQTMWRVVLLTASPGIFSAIMIGLGRAVGETMIVLMATGNTPVMDFSIFEGMRTLSANIAVEMPESEVGSTHYRVLFLAALVLFVFTFMFNTVAEIVRQRLRRKYSTL